MGKYANAALKYPVFALSKSVLKSDAAIEKSRDGSKLAGERSLLVGAGGGGSSRTGVPNCIAAFSLFHNEHGEPSLRQEVYFETGYERLVTSIAINSQAKLIAAGFSDSCLLTEFDADKLKLDELLAWQTDVVWEDDTPACQNAVAFSPIDPFILATCGDDKTACLWRVKKRTNSTPFEKKSASPSSPGSTKEEKGTEEKKQAAEAEQMNDNDNEKHKSPKSAKSNKGDNESDADPDDDANATDAEPSESDASEWEVELLHRMTGHSKAVKDVVFHPEGKLIVTLGADQSLRIWDVSTGKVEQVLPADVAGNLVFRRCAFAGPNRLLTLQARPGRKSLSFLVEFTFDGTMESGKQWCLGRSLQVVKGLGTTLQLHPPFLSVGDAGGGLTLVDIETLEALAHFPEVHGLPVTGLGSIPDPDNSDETYVVTGSFDKTVTFIRARRPRFAGLKRFLPAILILLLVLLMRMFIFSGPAVEREEPVKEL